MEGFISRQRRTKAILPDTNIDEYVYRSPQTGKLKQGWGRRASRTPVDGFSQPGGRAHQICHHDTLLRNCSLHTHPGQGGGRGAGKWKKGPRASRAGDSRCGDGVHADLIWDSGGKGVLAWKMWIHGEDEKQERGFHCHPAPPSCQTPRSKGCLWGLPQQGAGAD